MRTWRSGFCWKIVVRFFLTRFTLLSRPKGASKRLEIDLSSMTAGASHIEFHIWIIEEFSAIRPECITRGSGSEVVDPWNNASICLALIVSPVHGWIHESNLETCLSIIREHSHQEKSWLIAHEVPCMCNAGQCVVELNGSARVHIHWSSAFSVVALFCIRRLWHTIGMVSVPKTSG